MTEAKTRKRVPTSTVTMKYVESYEPPNMEDKTIIHAKGNELPEVQVLDVTQIGPDRRWRYVIIWREGERQY
jgi:hypothetical protein